MDLSFHLSNTEIKLRANDYKIVNVHHLKGIYTRFEMKSFILDFYA